MAGRPVVGLDIGTSGVRAAELRISRSGVTLERFGQVALPEGAVRGGEVLDRDAVAAALKSLWSQAKFTSKRVALGVANQRVVVRQIDLPWIPSADMRKSLPFQVQDFIPMPTEEAILDFHPLEEFTSDGTRMLRLLLVAASREMVTSGLDAITSAGLSPVSVDLNSFAVLRCLAEQGSGLVSSEAVALVDIGAGVTNIVVHQNGVPRFVRILLMGGTDITEAVAERLGVAFEQAEGMKHDAAISASPALVDPSPISRAIESVGSAFVEEVRGSLDYYSAQSGAQRIGRVVLSGGGSRLTGLAERLSQAVRVPVEPARPMSRLAIGKTGLSSEQLAYVEPLVSVPVGLAMAAER